MRCDVDALSVQQTEPQIAERRLGIVQNKLAAVLYAGAATGDYRRTICQVVDLIDVAAECHRAVI